MALSKKIKPEMSNDRLEESIEMLMLSFRVPAQKNKEEIWDSISHGINQVKKVSVVPQWKKTLRVAAVLIPFVFVAFSVTYYYVGKKEYYAQAGSQLVVILPDSSNVLLNADTRIEYNSATWNFNRKVKMTGEALFTVKKGGKFSVISGKSTTQVLGTVFNVYSRGNEVRVVCIEGKVQVQNNLTRQSVILNSGLKTVAKEQQFAVPFEEIKEAMGSWTNGEFFYSNEPLDNVFDELSRQFNIKIKPVSLKGRNYTGYFNKNNLFEALDLVCLPMNLKWKYENGVVLLTEQ